MNEIILTVLTVLFLFIAIMFTISIVINTIYKRSISATHIICCSVGWTGFITVMWIL